MARQAVAKIAIAVLLLVSIGATPVASVHSVSGSLTGVGAPSLAAEETCNICTSWLDGTHQFTGGFCTWGTPGCYQCDDEIPETSEGSCHSGVAYEGGCSGHGICLMSRLEVAEVSRVVSAGDARRLRELLRENPRSLALNTARRAIQVLDCSGSVVAQFALAGSVATL